MGNEKYKDIKTGNGYRADLAATTNNRIEMTIEAMEEVKSAIDKSTATMVKLNKSNTRLQCIFLLFATITALSTIYQLMQQ